MTFILGTNSVPCNTPFPALSDKEEDKTNSSGQSPPCNASSSCCCHQRSMRQEVSQACLCSASALCWLLPTGTPEAQHPLCQQHPPDQFTEPSSKKLNEFIRTFQTGGGFWTSWALLLQACSPLLPSLLLNHHFFPSKGKNINKKNPIKTGSLIIPVFLLPF